MTNITFDIDELIHLIFIIYKIITSYISRGVV
jgi:hypothetical protein